MEAGIFGQPGETEGHVGSTHNKPLVNRRLRWLELWKAQEGMITGCSKNKETLQLGAYPYESSNVLIAAYYKYLP